MTFCRPDVLSFLFWLYVAVKNEFMSDRCIVIFYVITSEIKKWLNVGQMLCLFILTLRLFENEFRSARCLVIFLTFHRIKKKNHRHFVTLLWFYVGCLNWHYVKNDFVSVDGLSFFLNFGLPSNLDIISARFK
jgi:hypothetical protein